MLIQISRYDSLQCWNLEVDSGLNHGASSRLRQFKAERAFGINLGFSIWICSWGCMGRVSGVR